MRSQRSTPTRRRSIAFLLSQQRKLPATKPNSPTQSDEEDDPQSTVPSAPSTARLWPRSLPPSPKRERWRLPRETSQLEALQSVLLQWTFANSLQDAASRKLTSAVETELHDRGKQVTELLQEVAAQRCDSTQRRRAAVLASVLELEFGLLATVDEDLAQLAEALWSLEAAASFSLRRVEAQAEPRLLLRGLKKAQYELQRIETLTRRQMPSSSAIQQLRALATVKEAEQCEVLEAFHRLCQLRTLYSGEAALTLPPKSR